MPRPGPPRPTYTIRLAPAGRAHIAARAEREGVTTSEMARTMLTYAAQHMPRGWRPAKGQDQ